MAERQGRYLTNQLNRGSQPLQEFKFNSMGMLAYIGKYQAITDVPHVKMQGKYKYFTVS